MPIKLSLERVITKVARHPAENEWGWVLRQSSYTREHWETFNIPIVCGVDGIYEAYIPDKLRGKICMRYYRQQLKEKALQELQGVKQNIQQQIDSLENVN